MKYKILKKIIVMIVISLIIPYIFSISSYAATKYTYYQGLKLTKMYMPEEEYWVVGISDWKTKEIKMPDKADDNKLITGIYDTSSSRGVFQGNIWLEKIDLSDSNIKVIGSYCFNNCTNFKNYINSSKLEEICGYAFKNANLESLTLNDGLDKIRISAFEDAFSDEKNIYVVDIPDTVTTIGENAFKVENKNYRVVLVGKKDSVAEEYCKTDSKCTFIERGEHIPTEEELIQEEIRKEKSKLFENPKFTYKDYNNTDDANKTYIFGSPATTLSFSNLESYDDIIEVEDGFIVIGSSYIDKYKFSSNTSKYFQDTFLSKAKGNQDGIIVKYNYNIGMEWFQTFGGGLNDQLHTIYRTKDGGYVLLGRTCSVNGDLQGVNEDGSSYHDIIIKYNSNFKIENVKLRTDKNSFEGYENEIIKDEKIKSGTLRLNTISDGKEGVFHGINGYEMNSIIRKYDQNGYLEWTKTFDRNTNKTDDKLVEAIEVEDGYVFIGNSRQKKKNEYNEEIEVEDAIIVKYNKPYDKIIINGMLLYEMNVGEQRTADLYYVPWEDVTIGELQWTSQNEQVATVDYKGNVTAISEGTTQIDLNVRGKTEKIIIKVKDPSIKHIENIALNQTEIDLKMRENSILIATINPEDTIDSKELVWTSNNPDVVTVDENGKIIAQKNGTATITVETVNGKKATCKVNVKSLQGDVNGDGKVNGKDWIRLYEHISETNELTGEELKRADVNDDGKVNGKDWIRLYEHINETNPLF